MSPPSTTIDGLDAATPDDLAAIVAPLDDFVRARGFLWRPTPMALALRDARGAIVGGLIGSCLWEWLRIDILAVAESLRGQGWGRRLMEEAERRAVLVGCRHAWVDTFSWQARPFYERLGYRAFGELPDYPTGHTRIFLSKSLNS